jgi:ADP-heptose:LPS heptosyltransferase
LGLGFPWKKILEAFPAQAVFIGLGREHQAFEKQFGRVAFYPTANLLQAAQFLNKSCFFIGNQSAIGAIANGLGMPMLTEVCVYASDCFFPRQNAHYCLDGALDVEILGIPFKTPSAEPITPNERLETEIFLPRCRKAYTLALQPVSPPEPLPCCKEILVQ